MERTLLWTPRSEPGLEHLHLIQLSDSGMLADGLLIGLWENSPFRARYTLRCDVHWQVREALIERLDDEASLALRSDGAGHWTTATNEPISALDGCLDLDISATPFTNTLAIRRLALAAGAAADLTVAYVVVPTLQVSAARQRYTCLSTNPQGGRYRYETLGGNFNAEITVDSDGLVVDYPDVFQRIWPQ